MSSLSSELEDFLAKREGKTLVFTNGCFDLLHAGHAASLQEAKSLGDLLIVGLNSDQSIQRLKGPERPIVAEKHRKAILQALKPVDFVQVFDESTADELLKQIRPDLYVKGGDYDMESIPEYQTVKAHGGRVQKLSFVPGLSTSMLIKKIQDLGQ